MERERPEYLEAIPARRWEFPWMGLWAVILIGMAGAGAWLHLRTGDAWTARFKRDSETAAQVMPSTAAMPSPSVVEEAQRQQLIAEIRLRRIAAERDAKARQKEELRCISGVAFRRIPGGWENVPGTPCP